MLDSHTQKLLTMYLQGTLDPKDELELGTLIAQHTDEELNLMLYEFWNEFEPHFDLSESKGQKMLQAILESPRQVEYPSLNVKKQKYNIISLIKVVSAIAATIAIVFSAAYFLKPSHSDYIAKEKSAVAEISTAVRKPYARHVQLPDHTIIVLNAGSTLKLLSDFKGGSREVSLTGEAYFDVFHDSKHPFIIHSGKVKTTVLGTAFAIRAWPGDRNVTVSVTRGRVKVESPSRVLAYLTVNQQIKYDVGSQDLKQSSANVNKEVDGWAQKDLIFRDQSLSDIIAVLNKRYGVNITIPDTQIGQVQMVSSFSKTEPLDSILDIICLLNPGIKYTTQGRNITISKNN